MALNRFHIIPLAFVFSGFGFLQQSGEASQVYHEELGFALLPGANSSPVSYYVVRKYEDPAKAITAENISKTDFISIAYSWGQSPANPKAENLFDKYEIAHCGYTPDTVIHHILYRGTLGCSPLDDLWKLAYSEYPYASGTPKATPQNPQSVNNPAGPGPGWSRNPNHPSDGQLQILHQYGADFFIDVIYGENAFHLLHDMQDAAWVSRYTSS